LVQALQHAARKVVADLRRRAERTCRAGRKCGLRGGEARGGCFFCLLQTRLNQVLQARRRDGGLCVCGLHVYRLGYARLGVGHLLRRHLF
jgi:hypothetical protein